MNELIGAICNLRPNQGVGRAMGEDNIRLSEVRQWTYLITYPD